MDFFALKVIIIMIIFYVSFFIAFGNDSKSNFVFEDFEFLPEKFSIEKNQKVSCCIFGKKIEKRFRFLP